MRERMGTGRGSAVLPETKTVEELKELARASLRKYGESVLVDECIESIK